MKGSTTGSLTYRFWLTGAPAASGAITLTFIPNSWTYTNAPAPVIGPQTVTFTPNGNAQVTADNPVSFTFHVNRKNDGTTYPLTCTIAGRSCAM